MESLLASVRTLACLSLLAASVDAFLPDGAAKEGTELITGLILALAVFRVAAQCFGG